MSKYEVEIRVLVEAREGVTADDVANQLRPALHDAVATRNAILKHEGVDVTVTPHVEVEPVETEDPEKPDLPF